MQFQDAKCALHLSQKSLKIKSIIPVVTYIIRYFSGQPRDFLPNFRHQRDFLCPADTNIASLLENFHNSQVSFAGIERNQTDFFSGKD